MIFDPLAITRRIVAADYHSGIAWGTATSTRG